jgi:hypothetical protein
MVTADNRGDAWPVEPNLDGLPMARALVLAFGAAPGNGFVGETAGMDRLTVLTIWLASGSTAEDTLWTTGVTIEVTGLVGLVTEVIGMPLDVDLGTAARCLANVLAGTTDPA